MNYELFNNALIDELQKIAKCKGAYSVHSKKNVKKKAALTKYAMAPITSGIGSALKTGRRSIKYLKGPLGTTVTNNPIKMALRKRISNVIKASPQVGFKGFVATPKKVGEITNKSLTLMRPGY